MNNETEQEKQDREDREYVNQKFPIHGFKNSLNLGVSQSTKNGKAEYSRRLRAFNKEKRPEKFEAARIKRKSIRNILRENLKQRYNISLSEKNEMANNQKGRCAVCKNLTSVDDLVVDHDHYSGKIRGLLCDSCNKAIGFMRDDPGVAESAARYLMKFLNDLL